MASFYEYLLLIFCFVCVSATATPTKITSPIPINASRAYTSYILKSNFQIDSSAFPSCDCDEQGKPLSSCQKQTAKASVKAVIDENGRPVNMVITKSLGSERADRYLIRSFRSARFSPALQNNQPIKSLVIQPINIEYMPNLNPSTCAIEKSKTEELVN